MKLRQRIILTATGSLIFNLIYALYHGFLGITEPSRWFLALCAYYTILAMAKFAAVLCERRAHSEPSPETEQFVKQVCGGLLLLLGAVLAIANHISLAEGIATGHGEIIMITIAAYTFTKVTLAVIRALRQRHNASPLLAAIRCIGYAEVAASVLTLQRSMLVSFGDMPAVTIRLMNALTGAGVYVFVTMLGILCLRRHKEETK